MLRLSLTMALATSFAFTPPEAPRPPETMAEVRLRPEAVAAWNRYVAAVEARRAREARAAAPFLALDFATGGAGAADVRRRLMAGEVVVEPVEAPRVDGEEIDVPYALVHHWRGAIFVPGATSHAVAAGLERDGPGDTQEDVLEARILERAPARQRVFLKLQRSKIITAYFNTEHDVRFSRPAADRAASASTATRIAEIADYGTPQERELTPGQDRGLLWRWNAYWRYLDVPGGTIIECESLTLSRRAPFVLAPIVGPIISSTARESMSRTLIALRDRFAR